MTKPNDTDLPCIPFNEYYRNRERILTETMNWSKSHAYKPEYRLMPENLKRLLERLPEELGQE